MIVDREPQISTKTPSNGTKPTERSFRMVAVVGAGGKTGELFATTLSKVDQLKIERVSRGGVANMLEYEPDTVILATPNPVDELLQEIAQNARRPLTLILPQNGVDVVPAAYRIFEGTERQITLIRANLFTTVGKNGAGLVYNPDKKRIALAAVGKDNQGSLYRTKRMFTEAGFSVHVSNDYKAMEWGKLDVNMFGLTAAVTGLSPKETLKNKQTFVLEVEALRGRRRLLRRAGIPISGITWGRNHKNARTP